MLKGKEMDDECDENLEVVPITPILNDTKILEDLTKYLGCVIAAKHFKLNISSQETVSIQNYLFNA